MTNPENPFPSDEMHNLYAPPLASSETQSLCPRCGQEMEAGELYSSTIIKWRGETLSNAKKFITGGDPIAKTKSGLGCKYAAYYCKQCKLFIIND
jgi:hypothetical protein